MWGPPTASGLSTPLRETIPESPGDDTFPDLGTSANDSALSRSDSTTRRSRAGTVPSQFPSLGGGSGGIAGQPPPTSKTPTRPTPSTSPFRPGSSVLSGLGRSSSSASTTSRSALLGRFRAGSMPQRSSLLSSTSSTTPSTTSPFGPSVFASAWNATRDRASTHTGAQSGDPNSPTSSGFQRDFADTDVKTLDYLGLVDHPPQQNKSADNLSDAYLNSAAASSSIQPLLANMSGLNKANRFRSFSTNAKEQKAAEEYGDAEAGAYFSGTITPAETAAALYAHTQAQIHQHNLDVQAFVNQATSSRPRARTAGALDSPATRMWRQAGAARLGSDFGALGPRDGNDYEGLSNAVQAMQLQNNLKTSMLNDFDSDTTTESTRALWLGGIPSSTTPSSLRFIFDPYGNIESARVLTHKNCGFVNFETVESAVSAKSALNGKEIFPGAGSVRIGYAKAPSASGTPGTNGIFQSPSPDPFGHSHSKPATGLDAGAGSQRQAGAGSEAGFSLKTPSLRDIQPEIVRIVRDLGAGDDEQQRISAVVQQAVDDDMFEPEIPPVPEPSHSRMFDAPRLRDIRKRIDNNTCSSEEIEDIAVSMLPEIAELSSDYLGNTVVQKLFDYCSEPIKEAMLQEIAPRLAEIGVHKNGTWAAQKIIDVANTPQQKNLVVQHLRPYAMAAFLDQYGNYVMQVCLKFGPPWNNFIFEAMICRLWPIAQGRFGARAMRACLECHHTDKEQQRMLAAAIALHSVQLATNANGALLLTWFLDTCTFPRRRKVLAPRLVPHLVQLCTHKVAYLTVLKLINQRNEPEARDTILQALFFTPEDTVLEQILKDQSCGATLIFKILTTPFFDEGLRSNIVENVRRVLQKIKAQPSQGYKRLMDEVGLSTRGSFAPSRDGPVSSRDTVEPVMAAGANPPPANPSAANGAFVPGQPQTPYTPALPVQPQRSSSMDSDMSYDQYNGAAANGATPHVLPANMNMASSSPMSPQNSMQYQQAMLAGSPGGYNFGQPTVNGYPPGMGNMPRHALRSQQSMPVMSQAGFGAQGGYPSMNAMGNGGMRMYQPYAAGGYMMPQHQPMHGQAMTGGGSRGRVSRARKRHDANPH